MSSIVYKMLMGWMQPFFDDITGKGAAANWQLFCKAKLRVVQAIVRFGFMSILCKCVFLVSSSAVLGFELCKQRYMLG